MERWNLYDLTDLFILFFTVMLMVLARMDPPSDLRPQKAKTLR